MPVNPIAFLLRLAIWSVLGTLFSGPPPLARAGEARPARQAEWQRTLNAAKQEGQLQLYSARSYDVLFAEFQKKYPEIKVSGITSANTPGVSQRILTERRAEKYLWDVYIGGASTGYSILYKGKVFDPIQPALILPEVVDLSKWWGGKYEYIDDEGKYLLAFNGELQPYFSYNTKLVNPKEFHSVWDFLHPRWKGKMVMFDPTLPGSSSAVRFVYYHPELGPEFLRRLLTEMDVGVSRDLRQLGDWLASGKYAICLFVDGHRLLEAPKKQGLPVDWFGPKTFKEGAILGSASGNVGLINKAPHPNAAKVAINWLLSREGQIPYQRIFEKPDSRRIDIPKDDVPTFSRRVEGIKYTATDTPERMDLRPIVKLINEAWKEKR